MPQLSLEHEYKKLHHRADPPTSREAAVKMVVSGELNRQQKAVLEIIRKWPHKDFTAYELAGGINPLYFVIERRKNELEDKGFIKKTGQRRGGREVWRLIT